MKWDSFKRQCDFFNLTDTDRGKILAFYHRQVSGVHSFTRKELSTWFAEINDNPNITRLIQKASWIKKSAKKDHYEIRGKDYDTLLNSYPDMVGVKKEIIIEGKFLPKEIYEATNRKYIHRVAEQINLTYENKAYDACSVMIRRLAEMLIIHLFIADHKADLIQDADKKYFGLDKLITTTISEYTKKGITQRHINALKECKNLGDLSAHQPTYLRSVDEVDKVQEGFRVLVNQLLILARLSQ